MSGNTCALEILQISAIARHPAANPPCQQAFATSPAVPVRQASREEYATRIEKPWLS